MPRIMGKSTAKAAARKGLQEVHKVTARTPAKKKKLGTTLLEKDMAAERVVKSSPGPSADDKFVRQAQKIPYDNFRSCSKNEQYVMCHAGLTLFERLVQDVQKRAKDELTMGMRYYDQLRAWYRSDDDPLALLPPVNPEEAKDSVLENALTEYRQHGGKPAALEAWLAKERLPARRSCIGLCKLVLHTDPQVGQQNAECILAILHWCFATEFHKQHADLWKIVSKRFEVALHKNWMIMKKTGVSPKTWYQSVQPGARLLLKHTAWAACLSYEGLDWASRREDLHEVVSTEVGALVFARLYSTLQVLDTMGFIDEAVVTLFTKNVTPLSIKESREALAETMRAGERDLYASFKPRPLEFKYRGVAFPVVCCTFLECFLMKVWCRIKELATLTRKLPGLFCEDLLCPMKTCEWTFTLDDGILEAPKRARQHLTQCLEDEAKATGLEIKDALIKHHRGLMSLGKWFKVEENFWLSQVGEPGETRLKTMMLAALPSGARKVDAAVAHDRCKELTESRLCQFIGLALRETCLSVVGWLA